jgi:1-deoxy-D-xylulose 5-phosphate reductoisomerase
VAVDLFIGGSIPLTGIAELVEGVLHEHKAVDMPDLETLVAADDRARARCRDLARARGWI